MNENLPGAQYDITKKSKLRKFYEENKILACTAKFTMVSVKKLAEGAYQKVNHNKSI